MTLSTATNRIAYQGSGSTTAFPIPFRFFANADITLYFNKVACSTGFTITGAGDAAGGTLTFLSAPAQNTDLIITRVLTLTQGVDLDDHDPLPASALEDNGLDRVVMLVQQLDDRLDRAALLDEFSCTRNLTLPEPEAQMVLAWKTDLSGLENVVGGATGAPGPTGPTGPAGAGAAPTVSDCSTSVTVPSEVWFTGSGVTVTVTNPHATPKVAKVALTVTPPTLVGLPGIGQFTAVNNVSQPTRDLDVTGCGILLWIPGTGAVKTTPNSLSKTVNTATAGPAANGRDQAGAFAINTWLYVYYMAKADGTVDTTISLAPPTIGPTLATDYLYWAFATAVFYNASSQLEQIYARGRRVWYNPAKTLLNNSTSSGEESLDCSGLIPPIALESHLALHGYDGTAPRLRVVTGREFTPVLSSFGLYVLDQAVSLPYVGSTLYFYGTAGYAHSVWLHGYTVPS